MHSLSRICVGALLAAGVLIPSLSHASSIFIKKVDTGTWYDVSFSLEFNVTSGGVTKHYADWEMLGTWGDSCLNLVWETNTASGVTCSGNQCTGDFLHRTPSGSQDCNGGNWFRIDKTDDPTVYNDLFVYANFTSASGCHHDYEYIGTLSATTYLVVGEIAGGSYSNGCWYGDYLRH